MTNKKDPFQVSRNETDKIFGNFQELAGDNFFIRRGFFFNSFLSFETKSIFWYQNTHQLRTFTKTQVPEMEELYPDQSENYLVSFLFVFGLSQDYEKMN